MLLKTNLHLHTGDDPLDNLSYSFFQAIDYAKAREFDVIALTCHKKFVHKKEYFDYALQNNILLISGIECKIDDKDVIILNCDKEAENLKTFNDLARYKKENPHIFILAPHPFVLTGKSLKEKLEKNIEIFDAIELTSFSNRFFNFNKKAEALAAKHGKPFIATSDTHNLKYLDANYALIETPEKTTESIFEAVKQERFRNKTKPMNFLTMAQFTLKRIFRKIFFIVKSFLSFY